jgi:hypothetical protein
LESDVSCNINVSEAYYTSYPTGNLLTGTFAHRKICKSTPNFQQLVAEGKPLPDNDYTHNLARQSFTPGYATQYSWYTGFSGYSVEDGFTAARSKAIANFYDNASEFESNVLVTLAELPKTVGLIGGTAVRLGEGFNALKRGNVRGALGALGISNPGHAKSLSKSWKSRSGSAIQFAANSWLELQYGWKPLLSEIDNAAQDLASRWEQDPADVMVRGTGKVFRYPTFHNMTDYIPQGHAEFRVGIQAFYQVIDENLRNLAGLGITNPLEPAWELLPYSFVVDWFVPVGSFLKSLRSLSGMKFIRGSESYRQKVNVKAVGTRNGLGILSPAAQMSAFRNDFERKKITVNPSRTEILQPRGFDDAIGITRALNGIALMAKAFGR